MKFFKPPYTMESIEKQFKTLSKKLHPDKGGNKTDFQNLLQEKQIIQDVIREKDLSETLNGTNKRIRMRRRKPPKVILNKGMDITKRDVDAAIKSISEMLACVKEIRKLIK